ncbi:MAG TPA: phospho-sugar mutase [Trebonia sp.]|nr:phospho-sugar mutase [Trebonia sp.]
MTGLEIGRAARAAAWREADPDSETRAELDQLLKIGGTGRPGGTLGADAVGGGAHAGADAAEAELAERFDGALAFGTAGIRAAMGAGPMRMNRLVAGRVAAGLARYIAAADPAAAAAGVVIGYDGRAKSGVFAADAARILSRSGIRVSMLPGPQPTPVLAFSVRHLGAAYGLMVTASHNPRQDNGIKVYVRDGGQLLPPADAEIAAFIDAVDPLRLPAGWSEGPFEFASADDAVSAYVTAVADGGRATAGPGLTVVHTALHGVGDATLRAVLAAAGWPATVPVAAQREPDPAFPTVPYPNPEEPGVLDLARATAEREGADLVLANDPDADRLAVMVPSPEGWRALTGDELGALLGDAVVARLARLADGGAAADPVPVVATTVVSSSLLRRLAEAAGLRCVTTLTGFKWIARAGGPDGALIYGYEQALGYAVRPDLVADKDGISAALLVLQVAAEEAGQGRALADRLDDIALAHGLHVTAQRSLRADGPTGLARLADAVAQVRKAPPSLLDGAPVTVTDLLDDAPGVVDLADGQAERCPGQPIPPANVLIWRIGGDARVMIRPSGTEPELKIYAEAVIPVRSRGELAVARAGAAGRVEQLLTAAAAALQEGQLS